MHWNYTLTDKNICFKHRKPEALLFTIFYYVHDYQIETETNSRHVADDISKLTC